jgi:uncharacterized membrane protein YgdD (TMEM256/DUF423 family)
MLTWQRLLATGGLLIAIAIMAGAFGAHGLREHLSAERLAVFETGARYNMYGGLGVVLFGLAREREIVDQRAGWLLVIGTVIFAGSLYALALSGATLLGAITPIGGAAMIGAWLWTAVCAITRRR